MTNPPDPKTKTPRTTEALAKLIRWKARSDAATMRGSHLDSDDPKPPDGWEFASTLELENQSLTRRLEAAEKWKSAAIERQQRVDALEAKVDDQAEIIKFGSEECDRLNAKLTALRTAASAARDALELVPIHRLGESTGLFINRFAQWYREIRNKALAALRAVLENKQ